MAAPNVARTLQNDLSAMVQEEAETDKKVEGKDEEERKEQPGEK